MRELERQQKEQEQNADRAFDMQASAGLDPTVRSSTRFAMSSAALGSLRTGAMSSRRSSEDSLEDEGRSLRDIKQEIKVRCSIFVLFIFILLSWLIGDNLLLIIQLS